uniref:Serine protease n=1 Tax=Peronospora matthiolae TaxID=2874970 RepID=A0AAV1UPU2_9STRA
MRSTRRFLAITGVAWTVSLTAAAVAERVHNLQRLRDFRGHEYFVQFDVHESNTSDDSEHSVEFPVEEKYFTDALVDHFAPVSKRSTWRQRYQVNEEFWGGQGYPVFLYIGGEGPLGPKAITDRTFVYYLAEQHQALLIALEHRFYGKSYPTEDMSLPNLVYLSSEQALADLAHFRSFVADTYGLVDEKWVAFGGSYPGNLAAWVKLKYPVLFAGSVASSAPLRAKTDFFEYMEVVGDGLRYFGGGECYHEVEQAIMLLGQLMDGNENDRKKVDELFKPCYPMTNEFDDSVFETSVMGAFQDIAQYNAIHDGVMTLEKVCKHFTKPGDAVEKLAAFIDKVRVGDCLDSKFEGAANGTVEVLSRDQFDGESSARQWVYQTCNEFGYFQTTKSLRSPFHALRAVTEANVGTEVCKRVYNINVAPDVTSTNLDYGSLAIEVQGVTFPSGTIDPWHALAVQNSTDLHSFSSEAVFIEGTAHCADMYYPSERDTPSLQWAHAKIEAQVEHYLKDTNTGKRRQEISELEAVE